jgi:glyoxylase-like metal-dependent hydrolase (beta-lactamase superfamily II)
MEVNTYLVYDQGANFALLVDPAEESQTLLNRIRELDLKDIRIILTHGHADHIYGVDFFKKQTGAEVSISEADAPMLLDADLNLSSFIGESLVLEPADRHIKDGEKIELGNHIGVFKNIPGHSPGGMILVFDEMVISGDTLFAGSIGRSDFPGGDGKALVKAIKDQIFSLSDRLVLPGHGPETKISDEKTSNPFFGTLFNV